MKGHLKFILLLIINSVLLYISYILTFIINARFGLDSNFTGYIMPNIYHLVAIKLFVFTLFMLYQIKQYNYLRGTMGIITGNALSILYLISQGYSIDYYAAHGLNGFLDLALVLAVILVFNLVIGKTSSDEEIEDINHYMSMKKDLQVIISSINEKKEELEHIDSIIKKKEDEFSKIKAQPKMDEERSFIPANTIELQSINCPVRIEIGDKSRCIGAVYPVEKGDKEESKIIVDENAVKTTIDDMKKRQEELELRAKKIEKKEEIIEKTVNNLEQISKTLKDRMQLLDEKEIYINKQLKILEEKEEDYSSYVHNEIYETLFNTPDIAEHEVKLKDKSKEIIIDKNDLLEIRSLIEREAAE